MIRLNPTQSAQTFSVIPSSYSATVLDAATISLVENGTNQDESNVSFSWALSSNGNFVNITMTPTIIFKEDQIYSLSLTSGGEDLFRDLIYITSHQTKTDSFKYVDTYTEHDSGETEYIVL